MSNISIPDGIHHRATHPFGPGMTIERFELDNGLKLLVSVDEQAPVICYQTWFGVGSRHEREGGTGIAHLFEHLMFNETENVPRGEFDRRLESAGAETNAATFLDWTYYVENLPREALPLVMELEADRMQHLLLQDEQVESEREVVANERRQTVDDDVDGALVERLYSEAFQEHGYRWPTIGLMKDIQAFTKDDCQRFYRTYYAPNNATVVVVGDVDLAALLRRCVACYGAIERAEIPLEDVRPEPPQVSERRVTMQRPAPTHKLAVGYKSPAFGDFDHPPLTLLNEILFGGRSSRAHRALVQQSEVAIDVRGYVGCFRDPCLYDMYLTAREDHDGAKLLAQLDRLVAPLRSEGVTAAELERAVARIELSTLQSVETVAGKAEQVGFCETVLGEPGALFARLEAYQRVTLSDILRVARRYLREDGRTVVEVIPNGRETPGEVRA